MTVVVETFSKATCLVFEEILVYKFLKDKFKIEPEYRIIIYILKKFIVLIQRILSKILKITTKHK